MKLIFYEKMGFIINQSLNNKLDFCNAKEDRCATHTASNAREE